MLEEEISIGNYKILRCDRNRHEGDLACYIRSDLSCNIISFCPCEIENIIVGTIYHPQVKIIS